MHLRAQMPARRRNTIPILTGFVGPDDGLGGAEDVLDGVASRRLITASDVTASAHTRK